MKNMPVCETLVSFPCVFCWSHEAAVRVKSWSSVWSWSGINAYLQSIIIIFPSCQVFSIAIWICSYQFWVLSLLIIFFMLVLLMLMGCNLLSGQNGLFSLNVTSAISMLLGWTLLCDHNGLLNLDVTSAISFVVMSCLLPPIDVLAACNASLLHSNLSFKISRSSSWIVSLVVKCFSKNGIETHIIHRGLHSTLRIEWRLNLKPFYTDFLGRCEQSDQWQHRKESTFPAIAYHKNLLELERDEVQLVEDSKPSIGFLFLAFLFPFKSAEWLILYFQTAFDGLPWSVSFSKSPESRFCFQSWFMIVHIESSLVD